MREGNAPPSPPCNALSTLSMKLDILLLPYSSCPILPEENDRDTFEPSKASDTSILSSGGQQQGGARGAAAAGGEDSSNTKWSKWSPSPGCCYLVLQLLHPRWALIAFVHQKYGLC